jgi:hypothetical protein
MIVSKLSDLPKEYACKLCGATKPVAEMVVRRRRELNGFCLQPRCKECHNARERGHRREYKRKYLQRWRKKNAAVAKSYWKDHPEYLERSRESAARYVEKHRDALAIRRRLKSRGIEVSVAEAEELLKQYGRCYPTRFGLTPEGLKECERIRSRMRQRGGKVLSSVEIRIMVYEDGHYITPSRQPKPYQKAAARLREWRSGQSSPSLTSGAGTS